MYRVFKSMARWHILVVPASSRGRRTDSLRTTWSKHETLTQEGKKRAGQRARKPKTGRQASESRLMISVFFSSRYFP